MTTQAQTTTRRPNTDQAPTTARWYAAHWLTAVLSDLRLLVWFSAVLQGGFALQASTE